MLQVDLAAAVAAVLPALVATAATATAMERPNRGDLVEWQ
jgi:hypothetical protein